MKQILFKVMGGAVFYLSLVFSSCGNLDNPLEEIVNSLPPQQKVMLAAALTNGAEVSVSFTIDGTSYTASFTKDEEGFSVSGIPALPDGYEYNLYQDDGIVFELVKVSDNGDDPDQNCLVITFDPETNTYAVYGVPGFNFEVEKFKINNSSVTIENAYPKTAKIYFYDKTGSPASEKILDINYKDNETWLQVIERYKSTGVDVIYEHEDVVYVGIPFLDYDSDQVRYESEEGLYDDGWTEVIKDHKVGKKDNDDFSLRYITYEYDSQV